MQIEGFLGTRADIIIDTVMLASTLLPFMLIVAIGYAQKGKYDVHKWLQIVLFVVVNVLVIALEVDIRIGGLDEVIAKSPYYGSTELLSVFIIHLIVAVSSTLLWFWLIVVSSKRYPVHFTFAHKKYGRIVFVDIVLTMLTGWGLYAMVFAN